MASEPHYVIGWGTSWVLGEDEDGYLRVPAIRDRIRRGQPWWRKTFNPRNPWHWPFWLWTRLRGGPTWIESGAA